MMVPFITIVMPVRNEERFIADTLAQLLQQDYPADRYEIIVADGMSDDRTRDIVRELSTRHPQVRLLDNTKRLSSAGRNIGFRNGKGDYFLVVDGHCYLPDDQLFNNVVDCFARSGADCLGRPQPLNPPGLSIFQKSVALARGSKLGHSGDSMIYGEYEGFASPVSNGAVYARHVFESVGYIDESFDAAEDVEFNYRVERAGFACYSSPKLTVRYFPRENLKGLFRQMVRYGEGRRKFTLKHPKALTLNQLIPAVFAIGLCFLMLSLIFFVFSGVSAPLIIIGIPYSIYLLFVAGETIRVMQRNGIQYAIPIPVILCVIHFALGYGFIIEVASRTYVMKKFA